LELWSSFFVGVTEAGRYKFFLFFFPLFSRLSKGEIEKDFQQHSIRGRIHQHILENPGTHFSRILESVEAGNGTTSYHLHILETSGFVKSIKKGSKKYYFEAKYARTAGAVFLYRLQAKLSFTELEILRGLREGKTLSVSQIAYMINKSPQTTSYNIRQLERMGFVRSYKENQLKMCSITGKGEKYLAKHVTRKDE